MNIISNKVLNNYGESLAEALVAILVSALGLLLLATMVQSSTNIINSSKQKINEYVIEENKLVDLSYAQEGTINICVSGTTDPIKFSNKDPDNKIVLYKTEYGKKEIISFK